MHYLKTIPLSFCAASLLMLATGCSSDAPAAPDSADGEGLWVQFEIANPSAGSVSRATSADLDKTVDEARVKSACVMLVNTDANGTPSTVCGIAFGADKVKLVYNESTKKTTITANMGLSVLYTAGQKYNLYVFTNLSDYSGISAAYNTAIATIGQTVISGLPIMREATAGIPMASENPIEVIFTSTTGHDTEATAFAVNSELPLTPLYSRIDFVAHEGISDFTYPISYTNSAGTTVNEVKVQFKKYTLHNAADRAYLLPQGTEAAKSVSSPPGFSFNQGRATDLATGAAAYIPEFIPTITDSKLTYSGTTYIQLDGALSADGCTGLKASVATAINNSKTAKTDSPTLYYYDDGTVQGALTDVAPASMTNWTELSYSSDVDGYKVTYRIPLRHAADGKDDGVVNPLEFAILRNHIYNVGVASVSALPHPWTESDPVENPNQDIELEISTPTQWLQWHRGAFEVEY